ncbi:glycosyltransferase family 2 protein [Propionibacterium freudenreichii]|uniref:glycosyltransferase family 2 protein n=1 Tax=Propionibacterium freudenreichii TaxID=1744 RepID=UPI0021A28F9C|nr:glycosyltransferase family 2 protein [Propionibacterium freudenreichii]MCT2980259.1 glycosyltransferase family 2 protein [Propionibacterium freudenreichii]
MSMGGLTTRAPTSASSRISPGQSPAGRPLIDFPLERIQEMEIRPKRQEGSLMSNTCVGIVTYNPDIQRLLENISAILLQTTQVIVVDNGSVNISEIQSACSTIQNLTLAKNAENKGIAKALNQLCKMAMGYGYGWILLLDQDSVAPEDMLGELEHHRRPEVGLVCPQIIDRRRLDHEVPVPDGETYALKTAARKGAITSGSLVNLSAYMKVGGFDDRMFIDYVDYDFDKRLLLAGYIILRTGLTYLLHECGHMEPTKLWVPRRDQSGKWSLEHFYSFGHSPGRCYYKARNRIIYTRKYWRYAHPLEFAGVFQLPFTIGLTLAFESDRKEKAKAFARGIRSGLLVQLDASAPSAPRPSRGSGRDDPAHLRLKRHIRRR